MKRRPLLFFFLITFGITWSLPALVFSPYRFFPEEYLDLGRYKPLYYLAVWSPAIAAIIVIAVTKGWPGLRSYGRRLVHWRVGAGWYALAFVGIPALYFLASLIIWASGEPAFDLYRGPPGKFLIPVLLRGTAGPIEELGWRGFALPLMQRHLSGLAASVILGFIWGLWHLPAFWVSGLFASPHGLTVVMALGLFLVQTVALSIILTMFYNGTGGSIPLAFIIHWLGNLPYPWEGPADPMTGRALVLALSAGLLAFFFRHRYLGRENLYTDATPRQ